MKQSAPSPLAERIEPEKATAFVVGNADDGAFKQMLAGVKQAAKGRNNIAVRTLTPAEGSKVKIAESPIVVVVDRRGREVGRGTNPEVVVPLLKRAASVGRIDWAMDGEPSGEALKKAVGVPSADMLPSILRTMSLAPEAMMGIQEVAGKMHFSNGALPRRQKEMVAAYVSALNKCKY
jgi:hypothetical protein